MLFRFTVKNFIQSLWYIMKLFTSWEAEFISYHLSLLVPGSAGPVTSLPWRTVLPAFYHWYLLDSRKRPRNQAWKTIQELLATFCIFFLSFFPYSCKVLMFKCCLLREVFCVYPEMSILISDTADVLPPVSLFIADINIWHKTCLTYLFI